MQLYNITQTLRSRFSMILDTVFVVFGAFSCGFVVFATPLAMPPSLFTVTNTLSYMGGEWSSEKLEVSANSTQVSESRTTY